MAVTSAGEGWFGADLIEPLAEVNVHGLELMRQRAREGLARGPLPPALAELGEYWSALDDGAIARAARLPYALVESSFGGILEWRAGRVREVAGESPPTDREAMTGLAREIAVLGWHLARSQRLAARMLLGMDPRCIDLVAGCSLRELQRVADAGAIEVHLRWADRPLVWRQALQVASSGDERALERVRLRGLQLLAAEVWPGTRC